MKFIQLSSLRLVLSTLLLLWIAVGSLHAAGKSCHRGFVVFAGEDAKGKVAFVMENTRSVGDRWDWTQASQAAWLFDETTGWVKLKNRYGKPFKANSGQRIGGEWTYQFPTSYSPAMTVHSDENNLHLQLKADHTALKSKSRNGQLLIANGEGSLAWKGRKISGKVYFRDDLHLGRGAADLYFQNIKGMRMEALYMGIENKGMMSMIRTNGKDLAPLVGESSLAMMLDTISTIAEGLQVEATAWRRMGLYEYPTEWQGTFSIEGRQAMFKLCSTQFQTTEYLLVAGTRLGWAKGFLCFDGETYAIHGITEVAGRFEGRKEIQEAEWRAKPVQKITPGSTWEATVR